MTHYAPINGLPQADIGDEQTHGKLDISVFKRTISPPLDLNLVSKKGITDAKIPSLVEHFEDKFPKVAHPPPPLLGQIIDRCIILGFEDPLSIFLVKLIK